MALVFSHGVRIHYEVIGNGPPVVLIHGLNASIQTNWKRPGWVEALSPSHRLVLLDLRGHGRSGKPHTRFRYSIELMAADVLAVLDREGIDVTAVMGYSMGSMVAMELLLNHPERFNAAIIGGMGSRFPARGEWRSGCRDEETGDPPPPRQRQRRRPGSRLPALFSFVRHFDPIAQRAVRRAIFRGRQPVDVSRLGEIHVPVLIVAGKRDALCPGTRDLATRIAGSTRVAISGRGHMTAVADPRFKEAVSHFLEGSPGS
jgi:pimeloyl-ACP methyl ester carboxylesterase